MTAIEQTELIEWCDKEIHFKRVLRDKWINMDISKIEKDTAKAEREKIITGYNVHLDKVERIRLALENYPNVII